VTVVKGPRVDMKTSSKIIIFFIFVALAVAASIGASSYVAVTRWHSPAAVEVNIRPGTSVKGIAGELARQEVIRTPKMFELYVRVKGVGDKLRAGMYDFPAGVTMVEVINKLVRGDVRQYQFKIIEGWTIKDIAAALDGKDFLVSDDMPRQFSALAHDKAFANELGVKNADSFEGYLFPDTYLVDMNLTADKLIRRLVDQYNQVWSSLDQTKLSERDMTPRQVLILASIVEKETGDPKERPLVASVFLNRLRQGIALQSDPTIIYGLPNFDGNIRKKDIKNPHPYNTYVHSGLPPGPIANPGKASLDAVLNPAKTNYLYFVSKNDGTHVFTSSLSDHLRAVRKYQINGVGRKK
jgi:peptidoglycan lytic transglycosylase G